MAATSGKSNTRIAGWIVASAGFFLAARAIYNELTKYNLQGKVVLVTGGSRGLGLVLARQLAMKGARLAICARTLDQLMKAEKEPQSIRARVIAIPVDLTDREEVSSMIHDIIERYGQLDVIINNAGIVQVGPVDSMTLEDYDRATKTNFWGPLYTIHAALPYFMKRREGKIVNISSIGGKIAVPHLLPYTASKFALTGLSEGLHAELKKHNIHVTTVIPHLMRTGSPMNITVKGNHEDEYAWFKVSDSSPLLSQKAEKAAARIIHAIEYNDSEAILTTTAKLATATMGLAPQIVSTLMSVANRFLPDNIPGGKEPKKGYEAESKKSRGVVSSISDRQALRNNEL